MHSERLGNDTGFRILDLCIKESEFWDFLCGLEVGWREIGYGLGVGRSLLGYIMGFLLKFENYSNIKSYDFLILQVINHE